MLSVLIISLLGCVQSQATVKWIPEESMGTYFLKLEMEKPKIVQVEEKV